MQIIQTPGNSLSQGAASTVSQAILVTAATNVRGVILKNSAIRSYFTAVNGIAGFFVFGGSAGALRAHAVYDSSGAAGPVNVPQSYFSDKEVQFPAGFDVIAQFSVTNGLLNYSVLVQIL